MGRQRSTDEATLRRFIHGAEDLAALAEDLSVGDLDLRSEPDSWTIREIIHHVSDDGDVWSMCIKKALAMPGALVRFEGFPGNEAWSEALTFARRDVGPAVRLMRAHRCYLAEILAHFEGAWDRSIRLADAEGQVVREMSVRDIVTMLTDHMLEHVDTIKRAPAGGGEGSDSTA